MWGQEVPDAGSKRSTQPSTGAPRYGVFESHGNSIICEHTMVRECPTTTQDVNLKVRKTIDFILV